MTSDNEMRNNPYRVPENYFPELKARLEAIPQGRAGQSGWSGMKPYLALAASFLILVTGGTAVLKYSGALPESDSETSYEKIQMADLLPVTDPYLIYGGYQQDSGEDISGSDIAEYLIDSGTTLEHIEYYEENK